MPGVTSFDSTKLSLNALLEDISEGKIQLPDFQREWVWEDERIRGLLSSVSLSYPIGAIMLLEAGGIDVRFKPKALEQVELQKPTEPERLVLDGQQRLTALFTSLLAGQPVKTKDSRGARIERWYYIDLKKALNDVADRDEAIVALPPDKVIKNFRGETIADYSTIEKECEAELFPLPLVFDTWGLTQWMMAYMQNGPSPEHIQRWNEVIQQIVQPFQQYQLPIIVLGKETPKDAVCQVFEKVNQGGVALTVFELLTATYAADDFNLREDWNQKLKTLKSDHLLSAVQATDFLQAITLLATRERHRNAVGMGSASDGVVGISCKRRDVLNLSLDEYLKWSDRVMLGFQNAAKLLHSQKIFGARDLPYRTQLVPLAAIIVALGSKAESDGIKARLARWYWCGVFGELYGGAIESRFARDLAEVVEWIEGNLEPSTIIDANFAPTRLLTLRSRNSAAYKGMHALLMRDGAQDFRTGEPIHVQMYFDDQIDIHHIFPQDWCRKKEIEQGKYDSIVNKAPLSARTNRIIGSQAPSAYLPRLERIAEIDSNRMDDLLETQVITPESIRGDDFNQFFAARQEALLSRIEKAIGKDIARPSAAAGIEDIEDFPEEETEEVA